MARLLVACAFLALVLFLCRPLPGPAPPRRLAAQSIKPVPVAHNSPPRPPPLLSPPPPARRCVRVHVYNASRLDERSIRAGAFGTAIRPGVEWKWLTSSDQHALGGQLLSRLLRARACPLASPEDADVFVVPLLKREDTQVRAATRDEANRVHAFMPPTESEAIKATCRRISHTDWRQVLHPHLTERTAYRHIFLHERFLEISGFCRGVQADFVERMGSNPVRHGIPTRAP